MADFQEQLNAVLGDPQAMAQIAQLARSLSGEKKEEDSPPAGETAPDSLLGGVDPRLLDLGMKLYGEYNAVDEKRAALLAALTPFLKEERRKTLEKVQRAARLAHVLRTALTLLGQEGKDHV